MKFMISIYFCFFLLFLSCSRDHDLRHCHEIVKVDIFSEGYPNVTYAISLKEKDVRENFQGTITNNSRIKEILSLIEGLRPVSNKYELGSIMGVSDFYCENKTKVTLLYDKFFIEVNDTIYHSNEKLVHELFGLNPDIIQ